MSIQEAISILIFNWKKLMLFSGTILLITFFILLLMVPIRYVAEVSVLPPEDKEGGGLASLISGVDAASIVGMSPGEEMAQLYAEILKSRGAAKYVLDNSEMMAIYDEEDWRRAVLGLNDDLAVTVTKESIIKINFAAKTPWFSRFTFWPDSINRLSAKIANLYVEALDSINTAKLNTKAKNSRKYIEKQITETEANLKDAQRALKDFQLENKTISLTSQIEAAINNAADVKSRIITAEIELKTLELNLSTNSQKYKGLVEKLNVLRNQYSKLISGDKENKDYLPVFDNVPEIQLEYAELSRQVKILNEVYIFLKRQYFSERIMENKNVPTVEVLDKAIPSIKPKSPRLVFHSALSAVFAFGLMAIFVLFKEYKRKELLKKSKDL